jgi:hypothetical protein
MLVRGRPLEELSIEELRALVLELDAEVRAQGERHRHRMRLLSEPGPHYVPLSDMRGRFDRALARLGWR